MVGSQGTMAMDESDSDESQSYSDDSDADSLFGDREVENELHAENGLAPHIIMARRQQQSL